MIRDMYKNITESLLIKDFYDNLERSLRTIAEGSKNMRGVGNLIELNGCSNVFDVIVAFKNYFLVFAPYINMFIVCERLIVELQFDPSERKEVEKFQRIVNDEMQTLKLPKLPIHFLLTTPFWYILR